MKAFRLLIIFSFILSCLLLLNSCNDPDALASPEKLQVEPTTLTLSWKADKDARMYTLRIQPDSGEGWETSSSKNSYSLVGLDKGSYKISVKAHSKESDELDSPWSEELPFVREAEPGFVMTLINGGTEYELTNKGSATGDIVIPDTYRSKPVTAIADRAFFNKSDVTSVKLGSNVKTIGSFAFGNCSYITKIEFNEGLVSIGESAFASCRLLDGTLSLPNSLESIEENAFSYCARLTEIKFGNGLTVIGKNAFTDCTGLLTLTFPNSLLTVEEYAFAACTSLSSIDFGTSLESIGECSFAGNTALTSVTIPDSVKTIGIGAFEGCSALASAKLGAGLVTIDRTSFDGTALKENTETNEFYVDKWFLALKDTSAASLTLADGTYGIADYALYANTALEELTLPNSVKIIGSAAIAETALINVVIGSGVERIADKAFMSSAALSDVILGSFDFSKHELVDSSLIYVGNYAFQNCPSLYKIEIPDTVKEIGTYAFRGSGLEAYAESGVVYAGNWVVGFTDALIGNVIIRSNTVGIANYAFYKCINLNAIELPSGINKIGRAAFYNCSELYSVTLPDGLEVIEDYTFYGCHSLKIKSLPAMLKSIGRSAFYKCGTSYALDDEDTDSDTLIIPGNVEYIGDYAFYSCGQESMLGVGEEFPARGIDIIIIGDGVKSIGKNAFYGFVTLKKVVIGDSVKTIGEKAFYNCRTLSEVVFGGSVEEIGKRAFYKCDALTSVILPDSLSLIGDYAFYKCSALTELDLGDGVKAIGGSAFYGCESLVSLTLPSSLDSIGKQAFRGCAALTSVVIPGGITEIADHAFYGCSSLTIYTNLTEAKATWSKRFNSSYRPTVWGCRLSEDSDYVVSLVKNEDSVLNRNSSNTLSAPTRNGYTFGGWGLNSTATAPSYTSETLTDAPNGTTLFAIWDEID